MYEEGAQDYSQTHCSEILSNTGRTDHSDDAGITVKLFTKEGDYFLERFVNYDYDYEDYIIFSFKISANRIICRCT